MVSQSFQAARQRAINPAGNHYSLRAEHEKAVKYFRRATELDRTYLSAWTLMGHEYVEMKNSHAAIEAYRRAVGRYRTSRGMQWLLTLYFRHQQEGLPSMVWPWPGLRTFKHASVCASLLSASYGTSVSSASYSFLRGSLRESRPYDVRLWQAQASCYEEIGW